MRLNAKLGTLAAAAVMLTAFTAANAQQYQSNVTSPACPVHLTASGALVDCHGWRLRTTARGWDNTCVDLDYLPSMYACNAK